MSEENTLVNMMKENEIELEWLFTLVKFNDHEGLMYFEPVTEIIKQDENDLDEEGVEIMNLKPQCFIIDGAKFVYDEDLDKQIIINAIDDVVTLTRIDGIQINIDVKTLEGFPFATAELSKSVFKMEQSIPQGHVEVN